MPSRLERTLRILLHPIVVILIVLVCGFVIAWGWPKSVEHSGTRTVAEYRGFGPSTEFSGKILGPKYYRLSQRKPDGFTLVVDFAEVGYNPFEARYADGTLCGKGTCRVEASGADDVPIPDFNDLKDAEFYKRDGTLASKVTNGTGTQSLYFPNGVKDWELELRDYKRFHLRMFYSNGQLQLEEHYRDGIPSGPYATYYKDGRKRFQGTRSAGRFTGPFTAYAEDGTISQIVYFDSSGERTRTDKYKNGKLVATEKQ